MKTLKEIILESVLSENVGISKDQLQFVKTKEKKSTTANPEGKPIYDVKYGNNILGKMIPYSGYSEKRKAGSRIVSSRKDVTLYHFEADKSKVKEKMKPSVSVLHGHRSPKDAALVIASYYEEIE